MSHIYRPEELDAEVLTSKQRIIGYIVIATCLILGIKIMFWVSSIAGTGMPR